ncbi:uncharacterized protein N7446_010749 [Penicillium canescens]|uniref:Uncharacterized protein n=1 Tax=Penicillium canescens TaxID=5083 RepID=A0AAD6IC43_PENCN|nr:uncharacterized protein N7446_010749 [Penicillium canescens]KAJ6041361.1 hypothetical protein N7460_006751 [Penicillium canescens]KAJ6050640.1 hypothetical protein N7446_010749 [Penicillium canescens]KAJ6065864.1 hypothetical protein N7444_001517 [Penicillium canescens]
MDGTKVGKNSIRVRVVNSGVELDTKQPSEIEGSDRRSSASITTTPTEMYSGDTLLPGDRIWSGGWVFVEGARV